MISFFAKTLKVGICTTGLLALAGVAAFATLGEDRTHAVVGEVHNSLLDAVDRKIDDPAAFRAQLREMEKEYPKRIAQVRGDLAEVESEVAALEREVAISERVVALAEQDLERLEAQLAAQLPDTEAELVAVRAITLDDHVYTPSRAKVRLDQIKNTRLVHANRAADAKHDLVYLEKQAGRLQSLMAKLEGERAEFQTQILALSREIDSIARNDRLIKLLDKRNRTIDECSRYESVSLDQITGRLSQIRTRQEAELELLSNQEQEADYEDLARMQLATEKLEAKRTRYLESSPAGKTEL